MKYATRPAAASDTLQLQSIGHVIGRPASEITTGAVLMWNWGAKEEVLEVVKTTAASIVVKIKSGCGYIGERRLMKKRLVCILEN